MRFSHGFKIYLCDDDAPNLIHTHTYITYMHLVFSTLSASASVRFARFVAVHKTDIGSPNSVEL